MEKGAVVGNSGKSAYGGDPEVLNSPGLGQLLVLFWRPKWKLDNEGRGYYERGIDPKEYHIIGCDDDLRRKLLHYRSHFLGSTFRWYPSDTPGGVIDRVFKNGSPEMSPNISFYSEDEYPHLHFALSCGILSSFCFPFSHLDFVIMEIVSTCNQDFATLKKFCQSIKGFHWSWSFRFIDFQVYSIPEIVHLLELVRQTFQFPLAQCWNIQGRLAYLVHQFSYGDFENLAPWFQLKDACLHKFVLLGEAPLGSSCKEFGAFFCRDIPALSITDYTFAHYARNCGSVACFTIYLCNMSRPYEKCILEFFLPAQEMDNDYPQTLLNSLWATIKKCLPNWILASGEQLGQVLSVKVINSSAHIEPESFKIGQHDSSLPHLKGSGCSPTFNLFENGTGQRSNAYSYEESATAKMLERVTNEAFQPRTSEEHSEIRGNTVTAERVDELEECIEPHSLTSLPRRSEEIFRDEGYTVASERVDNLVEVTTDDDSEYCVATVSKRLKKSKIPFTVDNISKHFGRPLKDAAESFGVSPSTFKRRCRSVGITWWQPSKRKLIDTIKGKQNVSSSTRLLQDTTVSQDLEKMTVKATYNGTTIKFELTNLSGISELEDNVIKRLHLERNSFSIKYQDNDNELILIGCDEDVQECMKFSRSAEKTTIRMLIHPPVDHYEPRKQMPELCV